MSTQPDQALRTLRETLRSPSLDIESFIDHVTDALDALYPSSGSSKSASYDGGVLKALDRHLPSIQTTIVTQALPHFTLVLNQHQQELVRQLFVPEKEVHELKTRRAVARNAYVTLSGLMTSKGSALNSSVRDFLVVTLEQLVRTYTLEDLYWSVWARGDGPVSSLQWDEVIGVLVGLPGRVANTIGRWRADGWKGDVPASLRPR